MPVVHYAWLFAKFMSEIRRVCSNPVKLHWQRRIALAFVRPCRQGIALCSSGVAGVEPHSLSKPDVGTGAVLPIHTSPPCNVLQLSKALFPTLESDNQLHAATRGMLLP